MSKKVLLASDAWHPQVNGVVKCVEEAKNNLEKQGYDVVLIHPGLFYSTPLPFYPEIKFSLLCYFGVKKIMLKEQPDYVHIFTEGPIGLAVRSLCLKNKLKFTTSCHTNFQHYVHHYAYMKVIFWAEAVYLYVKHFFADTNGVDAGLVYLSWFHNKSNGTMAITEELIENYKNHGFKHLLLWRLGTDTDLFKKNENSTVAKEYNLKKPVFIYFGRLAKEKNVEEFLELDLPGTKLVVGGGPYKNFLENKYGKDCIFTGYKMGQALVDFISVADVFVFPSLTDAFPLAIIEAFGCGLPVAAHKVMGLEKLVTPDVGVLDADLKKAALECLNINRENCRKKALQFSWNESIKSFAKNLVSAR